MIPKSFHLIRLGSKAPSALENRCLEQLTQYTSLGWNVKIWHEADLQDCFKNKYFYEALKLRSYAFAADYARFYILNKYGGVYIDTDVEVVKDFSPLLHYSCFCASENIKNLRINAAVFGCEAHHPFCQLILNDFNSRSPYKFKPIPDILTTIYIKNRSLLESVHILPSEAFYPYNPFDSERPTKQLMLRDITECTFSIHHWNFSWKTPTPKLLKLRRKILNLFYKFTH